MIALPKQIPQEAGCLVRLVHRGSRPAPEQGFLTFTPDDGSPTVTIPILGSAGTNAPDVWACCMWARGIALSTVIKSDVLGRPPTQLTLAHHYEEYPQQWHPVAPCA